MNSFELRQVLNEQIVAAPFSPSFPFNDEDCFVVDLIPFSNLQSMFVTFFGVLQ